jgi:SAM-dependent methyltransferase
MIDFHVIYTPGTVDLLLPFAVTLLQAKAARFTLVDNGCSPAETECLQRLANTNSRFSYLRLPGLGMQPHGDAVGYLLNRSEDRWFAMLDSDIIASGDFLAGLDLPSRGCAGVFTAPPVWLLPTSAQATRDSPFLGGPVRELPDGTAVGSTSGAIYDREPLMSAMSKLPLGLLNGPSSRVLPPGMEDELRARGWYFRRFGTARVAHLRMLLDGHTLRNVEIGCLHHIGGVSHRDEQRRSPLKKRLRRFSDRMLHGQRAPLVNLLVNSRTVLQHRSPEQETQAVVRRLVTAHVLEVMIHLREARPIPVAPDTGNEAVNEPLMALREALGDQYSAACRRVEALCSGEDDIRLLPSRQVPTTSSSFSMKSETPPYWDSVAADWWEEHPQKLWRSHSDYLNRRLIDRALASSTVERALKTDLFDEVTGEAGLIPKLEEIADFTVGIDLSRLTTQLAQSQRQRSEVCAADVVSLPFADGCFDLVLSNSTLDHLSSVTEIETGLAELARVLRPGGRLLLTLDNFYNPVIALRAILPQRLLAGLGLVPYQVGFTCGPRRLRDMVERVGLEPLQMGAIMHCPRVPAVAVAGILDRRRATTRTKKQFLRFLRGWEALEKLPTRFVSGYFITILAER